MTFPHLVGLKDRPSQENDQLQTDSTQPIWEVVPPITYTKVVCYLAYHKLKIHNIIIQQRNIEHACCVLKILPHILCSNNIIDAA